MSLRETPRQFDWRVVIGMIALVAGGSYASGAWGAGATPEAALIAGGLLWLFAAIVGALYGRWMGWNP